jgi:hypothetical protein
MRYNQELQSMLDDPSCPYWAKDVIKVAMTKDPVDAESVLNVLAAAFSRRATMICAKY